jgi:hypothetical protein
VLEGGAGGAAVAGVYADCFAEEFFDVGLVRLEKDRSAVSMVLVRGLT